MVCLHAKSHTSNSRSSVVIAIKTKKKNRMTAMLLFDILRKEFFSEVAYFSAIC
jgi:hypothetical protein